MGGLSISISSSDFIPLVSEPFVFNIGMAYLQIFTNSF